MLGARVDIECLTLYARKISAGTVVDAEYTGAKYARSNVSCPPTLRWEAWMIVAWYGMVSLTLHLGSSALALQLTLSMLEPNKREPMHLM